MTDELLLTWTCQGATVPRTPRSGAPSRAAVCGLFHAQMGGPPHGARCAPLRGVVRSGFWHCGAKPCDETYRENRYLFSVEGSHVVICCFLRTFLNSAAEPQTRHSLILLSNLSVRCGVRKLGRLPLLAVRERMVWMSSAKHVLAH
jgi:hypothetical protein